MNRLMVLGYIMIGISLVGFGTWWESADWSDSGHINWIGQLTLQHYENKSVMFSQNVTFYLLPYSVQTTSHGTWNFTVDVHPDALMTWVPTLGLSVSVTHDRDGMTFPVIQK
jgi:hypothetical protein